MGQDDPPNYDAATLVAVPLDGLEPLKNLAAFQTTCFSRTRARASSSRGAACASSSVATATVSVASSLARAIVPRKSRKREPGRRSPSTSSSSSKRRRPRSSRARSSRRGPPPRSAYKGAIHSPTAQVAAPPSPSPARRRTFPTIGRGQPPGEDI